MDKFLKRKINKVKRSLKISDLEKAFTLQDEYKIYEEVFKTYKNGEIDQGIWAKALALSEGKKEMVESIYIQLKVEQIVLEIKAGEIIIEEWMEELSVIKKWKEEEEKRAQKFEQDLRELAREEEERFQKEKRAQEDKDRWDKIKKEQEEVIKKSKEEWAKKSFWERLKS